MNLLENKYIIANLSKVGSVTLLAFIIAFLLAPLIGKIAKNIGAVDLPARLRRLTERGFTTRIHEYEYPKLGGIATVLAIFITLLITNNLGQMSKGVLIGVIIIAITGFLDDKFEIGSKWQLLGQLLAAAIVVISGITVTSVNLVGTQLNFNWLSGAIHIAQYTYNFIFPADILTILWIVGMVNVINWVGGVDALNASVTSIALVTLMLLTLSSGNIPLAMLIGVHLGGVLGVLPFNYPPGKILYGSAGDFLNGFLLAVFAILGGNKWSATLIVLALPIIDGMIVVFMRMKTHPEVRRNPLRILQISDKNHFHHRLLAAGYSKKMVTLVESTIMIVICTVALYFSNIRKDAIAFIVGMVILLVVFVTVFFLKIRHEKRQKFKDITQYSDEPQREAVVKVIYQDEKEKDEEKFVY